MLTVGTIGRVGLIGLGTGRRAQAGAPVSPPVNTAAPVVSGVGYVGQTLTATTGTWSNSPAGFAYQWQRNGVNIDGATSSTYAVTLADEGLPVRCVVTASNAGGSAAADSNAIEQWVPSDLGADLRAHWDAEAASTFTLNGAQVGGWADRSGNGFDVVQTVASEQPVYSATGWGGRPQVACDFNAWLVRASPSDIFRDVDGGRLVMVQRAGSPFNNGAVRRLLFVSTGGFAGSTRFGLVARSSGQAGIAGRRFDADPYLESAPGAVAMPGVGVTTIFMGVVDYSAALGWLRINGTQTPSVPFQTAGPSDPTNAQAIAINATGTGLNRGSYIYREVMILRGAGTVAENELIEGYCAWRTGEESLLPIGHTYRNAPPTP